MSATDIATSIDVDLDLIYEQTKAVAEELIEIALCIEVHGADADGENFRVVQDLVCTEQPHDQETARAAVGLIVPAFENPCG